MIRSHKKTKYDIDYNNLGFYITPHDCYIGFLENQDCATNAPYIPYIRFSIVGSSDGNHFSLVSMGGNGYSGIVLNQEQATLLLPYLQHFVDNGSPLNEVIPIKAPDMENWNMGS